MESGSEGKAMEHERWMILDPVHYKLSAQEKLFFFTTYGNLKGDLQRAAENNAHKKQIVQYLGSRVVDLQVTISDKGKNEILIHVLFNKVFK